MATGNSATVTSIYQSLTGGLTPSSADLATYTALMTNAGWTAAQVATAFEGEPFITNVVDPVIREYQAAFGRVPDQAGMAFWIKSEAALDPNNAVLTTTQLNSLATTFVGSAEFQARYGSVFTPTTVITNANGAALVTALYENILGRAPDAAGLSYWLNAGTTVANLLSSFSQSSEFITDTNSAITAFQNLEVAGTPQTSGSLLALSTPGSTGTSFTLTTGIDSLTGTSGVDTFYGSYDDTVSPGTYTVNAGDSINGNGGNDTFKITLANYDDPVDLRAMTVNNVANFLLVDATNSLDDDVYLGGANFSNVTVSGPYDASIYGINEGATATFTIPTGNLSSNFAEGNFYFNATNATTVTMNDVVTGAANSSGYMDVYFYHGDNDGLAHATTVNANFTLQNIQVLNSEGEASEARQIIYVDNVGNSNAVINTTLNVQNNTSDGSEDSSAEQQVYQTGNATVHSTINVSNTTDVWVEVDANDNSSVTAAAANNTVTINASNVNAIDGHSTGIGAYGFDTVTLNVTGAVTLNDGFDVYESNTTTASSNSETVTINASANFKADSTYLNYYGSTKLVVTGSGNVNVGDYEASQHATLSSTSGAVVAATVDASALTGNFTIDAQDPINSIKGGAGNDVILLEDVSTFGSSSHGGLALDGGAGANTVGFTGAGYASVVAGSGANIAKIVNFQTLEITDSAGVPTGTYDLSLLVGSSITNFTAGNGVADAGTATVTHLQNGSTVTWEGNLTAGHGDGALVATLATTSTSPALNLVLNGNFSDNYDTSHDVTTNIENVSAANVSTLNVNSTGTLTTTGTLVVGYKADTATNVLTVTDTSLATLTVTGNEVLSFTAGSGLTKLATIDASANTAGLTVDVSAFLNTQALTIKGTATSDSITVGGGLDTITLNGGTDTVHLAAVSASSASFPIINDIVAKDVLEFDFVASLANANGKLGAALSSGVVDYQTYLNAGAAAPTAGTVSWFQFGGDTYVEVAHGGDTTFTTGSDSVMKLVGLHDLSNSVIAGHGTATGTLTIV